MDGLGAIVLHGRYDRKAIAESQGLSLSRYWQQGVIRVENDILLIVTLDKSSQPVRYQYQDRFLSNSVLHWQSQNKDSQRRRARKYQRHVADGRVVHLFVRRAALSHDGTTSPFIYLGPVTFKDWNGDNPVNVRWVLDKPIPPDLREELLVPDSS
jgi:hypothetical protein